MTNLPTLSELYKTPEVSRKENALNVLLNHEPNKDWVKEHPMAKGAKYIPIGIIEGLLTNIFIKWRVEVKETKLIANSIVVTVRLHYKDPVSNEWEWQDGIGASVVQTDKGASATDFTKVKSDAIMKCAPSAESYAIKDAAEKLGKLFGKDLNRSGKMDLSGLASKEISQDLGINDATA